jgi:hypothetical protein
VRRLAPLSPPISPWWNPCFTNEPIFQPISNPSNPPQPPLALQNQGFTPIEPKSPNFRTNPFCVPHFTFRDPVPLVAFLFSAAKLVPFHQPRKEPHER